MWKKWLLGLTFNHAFSNGPVCSVARSTLALGVWGPRMGIQYHRKAESVTLPKGVLPWSAILRNAGYYCANNSKQDYNFIIKELMPGISLVKKQIGEIVQRRTCLSFTCNLWGSPMKVRFTSKRG